MMDDSMQDAGRTERSESLQGQDSSSSPEQPGASQHAPGPAELPIYMQPSFYEHRDAQAPEPEEAGSYSYGYTPPLDRYVPPSGKYSKPPRRLSPFWRAVSHLPGQYWRVLTRPGVVTFYMVESKASWGSVWGQLIGYSIINLVSFHLAFLPSIFQTQQAFSYGQTAPFGPTPPIDFIQNFVALIALFGLGTFLSTLLGFFFSAWIYYVIAGFFGSRGTFLEHCYCTALITMPLSTLAILLSAIPQFGSGLRVVCIIYEIVLRIFMTMAVHRLSNGKAALAVLIPALLFWGGVLGMFSGFFPFFFL